MTGGKRGRFSSTRISKTRLLYAVQFMTLVITAANTLLETKKGEGEKKRNLRKETSGLKMQNVFSRLHHTPFQSNQNVAAYTKSQQQDCFRITATFQGSTQHQNKHITLYPHFIL